MASSIKASNISTACRVIALCKLLFYSSSNIHIIVQLIDGSGLSWTCITVALYSPWKDRGRDC
jgi:hypothetical protein